MYFHRVENIAQLLAGINEGDRRSLARAITIVENNLFGSEQILTGLTSNHSTPVIGITGPPGAGKSTLINALLKEFGNRKNAEGKAIKIAVLAIDPSSPFTQGSLLGDRLRMTDHFENANIYIRSLATRGALGGLSAKTLEICDVLRAASFDLVLIETVGVGQSEVEIVSLADTTIVVLVPESGDEIQALKSGIMEIADIFVINKSDREGADRFAAGIQKTLHERPLKGQWSVPVLKTIASKNDGVSELADTILNHRDIMPMQANIHLMAERAFRLVQQEKMKAITVKDLEQQLQPIITKSDFNLYTFVKEIAKK